MKREPYIDINTMRRNLTTPRTGASPAERACAVEVYETARSIAPAIAGVLAALIAAVGGAYLVAERIGLPL